MNDDDVRDLELISVLFYPPGHHVFDPSDHVPRPTHVQAIGRGGQGGAGPRGEPGEFGSAGCSGIIPAQRLVIVVGRGGRGVGGGRDGESGFALIELYRNPDNVEEAPWND